MSIAENIIKLAEEKCENKIFLSTEVLLIADEKAESTSTEQDWEKEETIFFFKDGSSLKISGITREVTSL